MKKQFFRYASITLGCILMAIAINGFYIPNKLLSGGMAGFCVILFYTLGLPISLTNLLINVPLFVVAYRLMSRDYFISGIYGTLAISFFLNQLSFLSQLTLVQDHLLACIAGGLLHGIGCGIIYRVGGNTGGTDIIGAIIQKFYSISIGTTGFMVNIILLFFSAFLFGLEPALYTLCSFFVVFKVSNAFADGFDYKKSVLIVSENYEEISAAIMRVVGRGVTYLHAEGAFTRQDRQVLFVVVKLTQIAKIKSIVKQYDPHAFMIIQDASDVLGRGFTQKQNHEVSPYPALRTGWKEEDEAAKRFAEK